MAAHLGVSGRVRTARPLPRCLQAAPTMPRSSPALPSTADLATTPLGLPHALQSFYPPSAVLVQSLLTHKGAEETPHHCRLSALFSPRLPHLCSHAVPYILSNGIVCLTWIG